MSFPIRTTKPSNNKFYMTTDKGGYNQCIKGSPTDPKANVLANCVGYACGRFNEVIGKMLYPKFYCNAENFIEVAKQYGLEISMTPVKGAILVMQKGPTLKGSDGAGHVIFVEEAYSDNHIYTSESAYGGTAFYNVHRYNNNGRWGMGPGYIFRGFIVNPHVKVEEKKEEAKPTTHNLTNVQLACEVWEGKHGNGEARRKSLGTKYTAVQSLVEHGVGKSKTSYVTNKALADEVWQGLWGNGSDREALLTNAGFDYDEVQKIVNNGR